MTTQQGVKHAVACNAARLAGQDAKPSGVESFCRPAQPANLTDGLQKDWPSKQGSPTLQDFVQGCEGAMQCAMPCKQGAHLVCGGNG